jgi:hypothetical protein
MGYNVCDPLPAPSSQFPLTCGVDLGRVLEMLEEGKNAEDTPKTYLSDSLMARDGKGSLRRRIMINTPLQSQETRSLFGELLLRKR